MVKLHSEMLKKSFQLVLSMVVSALLFFFSTSVTEAMGCTPRFFAQTSGNQLLQPISGTQLNPASYPGGVYIAYEVNNAEATDNPGIHWCWRNTEGTGLGATSCQSNSLPAQYFNNVKIYQDASGTQYAAAPFSILQGARAGTQWEVAPWLGNNGGSRQCTAHGTTVITTPAAASYSCNNPGVQVSHTGRSLHVAVAVSKANLEPGMGYKAVFKGTSFDAGPGWQVPLTDNGSQFVGLSTFDNIPEGTYYVIIAKNTTLPTCFAGDLRLCGAHTDCGVQFTVDYSEPEIDFEDRENLIDGAVGAVGGLPDPYALCKQISPSNPAFNKCQTCFDKDGIWTAVGCIQNDAKSIVQEAISIGLGIAGGVTLLVMLAAGFLLTTAQNDPKRTTQAREMITAAVTGLLFIIFSVTILQFIGVTVLQIPGFGG